MKGLVHQGPSIFPTGWHGVELAKMQPGENIVIYGAGPVGLMAAQAAQIKGAVGVYVPEDPGASSEPAAEGKLAFDFGTFFFNGQSMGTGQCNTEQYNAGLRDLITEGKATPGFLVSHEMPPAEAPQGYDRFDKREDGWTNVVLHP